MLLYYIHNPNPSHNGDGVVGTAHTLDLYYCERIIERFWFNPKSRWSRNRALSDLHEYCFNHLDGMQAFERRG